MGVWGQCPQDRVKGQHPLWGPRVDPQVHPLLQYKVGLRGNTLVGVFMSSTHEVKNFLTIIKGISYYSSIG